MSNCTPGCRCDLCIDIAKRHIQGILKAIGDFEHREGLTQGVTPANQQWFKDNADALRRNFPEMEY